MKALFDQVLSISKGWDFTAFTREALQQVSHCHCELFLPYILLKFHCCNLHPWPLSLHCTPQWLIWLCLLYNISISSKRWLRSTHVLLPVKQIKMLQLLLIHSTVPCHHLLNGSPLDSFQLVNISSGPGEEEERVQPNIMPHMQPHEHQISSPLTCQLCSCQCSPVQA